MCARESRGRASRESLEENNNNNNIDLFVVDLFLVDSRHNSISQNIMAEERDERMTEKTDSTNAREWPIK